jgi:hypothetical protein
LAQRLLLLLLWAQHLLRLLCLCLQQRPPWPLQYPCCRVLLQQLVLLLMLLLQPWDCCCCCCLTCVCEADHHQQLPLLQQLYLLLCLSLLLLLLQLPLPVVLWWQGCQQVLQAVGRPWPQLQAVGSSLLRVWAVWGQVGSTALAPGLAQAHSPALHLSQRQGRWST